MGIDILGIIKVVLRVLVVGAVVGIIIAAGVAVSSTVQAETMAVLATSTGGGASRSAVGAGSMIGILIGWFGSAGVLLLAVGSSVVTVTIGVFTWRMFSRIL